jgi:hypothetical protein
MKETQGWSVESLTASPCSVFFVAVFPSSFTFILAPTASCCSVCRVDRALISLGRATPLPGFAPPLLTNLSSSFTEQELGTEIQPIPAVIDRSL